MKYKTNNTYKKYLVQIVNVVDSKATADTRDREQVTKIEKKLPCYVVSHIYIHSLDV
jgi:hypothetical protein